MASASRVSCSYFGCKNMKALNNDLCFFKVPANISRCEEWLKCMGRNDLLQKDKSKLHNNIRVCQEHFLDKDFSSTLKKYLCRGACPMKIQEPAVSIAETVADTSKVVDVTNLTLPPSPGNQHIAAPAPTHFIIPVRMNLLFNVGNSAQVCPTEDNRSEADGNKELSRFYVENTKDCENVANGSPLPISANGIRLQKYEEIVSQNQPPATISIGDTDAKATSGENVNRLSRPPSPKTRTIRSLRVQLCRCRSKIKKLKCSTPSDKDKVQIALKLLEEKLTPTLFEIVSRQLKPARSLDSNRHWSSDTKAVALSIYLKSPGAYSLMRKCLKFPSKATILRSLRTFSSKPQ